MWPERLTVGFPETQPFNGPGSNKRRPGHQEYRSNAEQQPLAILVPGRPLDRAGCGPRGGEPGKLRTLLLGDSTTIGSVCRQADPDGPHLEDVIRLLLAAEKDLPPAEVINQGRDGEFIRGLLSSGRYDKEIATLKDVDYVLIRYGLNDVGKREEFEVNFPRDYVELIGRLRGDFPRATIVPITIIPYMTPERDESINRLVRKVAESEHLALFDVYTRYRAELTHGPNMLNYRRYPLEKIPERHREWVKPFVRGFR
jgi:lysophospholipase L1-like esterase